MLQKEKKMHLVLNVPLAKRKKNAHSVRRLMTDKTFTASIMVGYKNYGGL